MLWTDAGPHFVDLDDCLMGPAIQDLWMLLSGTRREMGEQLAHLLEGYSHFATFDTRELVLIESLRTLRMIHYSAWLARRWSDPAFPGGVPLVHRAALLGEPGPQLSDQISDFSLHRTAVMSPCFLRPCTIRRMSPFQPWPRMIFPAIASSM